MRLACIEHGHTGEAAEQVAAMRAQGYLSDIALALRYRPELFGRPFSKLLQDVMNGPSDWTKAERELFAAFVSAQSQCPF